MYLWYYNKNEATPNVLLFDAAKLLLFLHLYKKRV